MNAAEGNGESRALSDELGGPMPVLDVESAISRMLGSRSLYVSMLDMFRAQLMTDIEQVHDALARGDQREALRLIHSTKGAAKILGAEHLGSLSEDAWDAVQGGMPEHQSEALAALVHGAAITLTAVDDFLRNSSG